MSSSSAPSSAALAEAAAGAASSLPPPVAPPRAAPLPPRRQLILGIEGSANKCGVGVVERVDDARGPGGGPSFAILSNPRKTFVTRPGTGFLPRETAWHHQAHVAALVREALAAARVAPADIRLVAFTRGPGMGAPLTACALAARTLSLLWRVPLIGVNHCVAHIEAGRAVTGAADPVVLYVSGGNTQVICYAAGRYRVFGETIDVAVGNALDRVARLLGLPNDPSPGAGPPRYIPLPYVVKGMDVSFSGFLSYFEREAPRLLQSGGASVRELAFSVQETAFAALVEITERAMAATGRRAVLCVGGVGCNARLQGMVSAMAAARGAASYGMDARYCVDNGAMIAIAGALQAGAGETTPLAASTVTQRFRTDEQVVGWRDD